MKKIIIFTLSLCLLFVYGCKNPTPITNAKGFTTTSLSLDKFAKCITDAGLKMYGTETCSHCQKQKILFGDSFQYINYIDCTKTPNECISAGIEKIPAWEFADGTKEIGKKTLEELAQKTNCSIK